jgi:hypothetical protein
MTAVQYRRQYATDKEAGVRMENFKRNLQIIQVHSFLPSHFMSLITLHCWY